MADGIVGKISVGDGATFTPSVSSAGVLSWSNNKNLPNPESVDIAQAVVDAGALDSRYLKLSGGTMTGNITFNKTNPDIIGARTTGRAGLFAGSNNFDGAGLQLFGRNDATYAGMFYLRASTKSSGSDSGGAVFDLVGRPNGLLTWNSKEVITAAGGTMMGAINMNSNAVNMGTGSNDDGRMYTISSVLRLTGGSSTSTGSYIDIGSSSSGTKGIVLAASDGNGTTKQLKVVYDGTFTWDGNAVALSKDVLALSGGTLTGNVTANKQFFELTNSTLNGRNSIFGGTNSNNGAFLFVYGKDHSSLAGQFVLHANDGSNTSELVGKPDGILTWKGLDIAPQKWVTDTFADKSVASGTRTNLGSFTLTKGTWLICIAVNFPSNANGYRDINISNSSAGSQLDRYRYYRCAPANGSDTHITWTIFDAVSANTTTRYVNVLQNSGSALTVGGGYIAFRLSADA